MISNKKSVKKSTDKKLNKNSMKETKFSSLPEVSRDGSPEGYREGVQLGIAKVGKKRSTRGKESDSALLKLPHPLKIPNLPKVYYFKDIVATIREPLVILDGGLRVVSANNSFYKFFKVKQKETIGNPIYELGDRQWDIPELRHLLETILPQKAVFNEFKVEHDFPTIGKRSLILNARRIPSPPREALWILLAFEDVTERMRLEHTLRVSEERFRRAFETAHDGMLLIEKTGGLIVNSNQAAQDMLGYSERELLQKYLWNIGSFVNSQQFKKKSLDLEKLGISEFLDTTIHTKQGANFPADVYIMDRASVFQCNIRNTTERKPIFDALKDNERKYFDLVDQSPNGIFLIELSGKITSINKTMYKELGFSREELLSMSIWDIIPERYLDQYKKRLAKILGGKDLGKTSEYVVCGKDGKIHYVEILSAPHYSGDGLVGFQGIARDITARKQAEGELTIANKELAFQNEEKEKRATELSVVVENLKRNEVLLRETGALAKVGGTEIDLSDMTLNWTEEIFRIHELEPGKIPSREEGIDYYAPEARPIIQEAVNKAITTGEGWDLELPFITAKGKHLWMRSMGKPEMKDGRTSRILSVFQDITNRKQAEDEVRQLNASLEQRVEERTRELRATQEELVRQEKLAVLGKLAGSVGHELRNPLGVISNAVYYLKLIQPEADDTVKKYHAIIEQEVRTSKKIISDLLDLTRNISADRNPTCVPELVQRVLVRFPVMPLVEVELKYPPDLPAVFADERQVEQVLGNLVVNACQAMANGGKLTISAHRHEGIVTIAVKDTGEGIPPENMEKIFDPLFSTKITGIGLGLPISQRLAKANGGWIEVQSERGKGSTFILYLSMDENKG